MTTTAAHLRPRARSAFVPPVRPEPTVRGSVPCAKPGHDDPDRDRARQVRHRHQHDGLEHERPGPSTRSGSVPGPDVDPAGRGRESSTRGSPPSRPAAPTVAASRALGCAPRDGTRTIDRDDPSPAATRARHARGTLTHGRRILQRLRSRRARRGHRRLRGGLPGRPARPARRPRGRGQDRRHVPPSRLHPDEGPARIGLVRRADQARQGLRHDPAGRSRPSTTPPWPPAATRS